jgi:hypothetical protein
MTHSASNDDRRQRTRVSTEPGGSTDRCGRQQRLVLVASIYGVNLTSSTSRPIPRPHAQPQGARCPVGRHRLPGVDPLHGRARPAAAERARSRGPFRCVVAVRRWPATRRRPSHHDREQGDVLGEVGGVQRGRQRGLGDPGVAGGVDHGLLGLGIDRGRRQRHRQGRGALSRERITRWG